MCRNNVTLNLFQGLIVKMLIIKSNEMLKQVQHDMRIKDMT